MKVFACPVVIGMLLAGGPQALGASLSAEELKNAVYQSPWTRSGSAPLTDGEYREPVAPAAATETRVKLTDWIAYGKVNGEDAAAVVLVTDPGGSGTFYDLALVIRQNARLLNPATAHLGDRVRITSRAMEGNAIMVNMTVHGPNDRMCCPTQSRVRKFAFQDDRLVPIANDVVTEASGPQDIVGVVWKWMQTLKDNGDKITPANPDDYRIEFLGDGQVNIRADCNGGGGTYKSDGQVLSIEITHTTLAACPPGSLEKDYIEHLNAAAHYFLENNHLYIDLKFDTGTMKFARQ
ncbi:MAG: META domain-containing protein [Gammaproteobacteria bacterium]